MNYIKQVGQRLIALYRLFPAACNAVISGLVIAVGVKLGVDLDPGKVETWVLIAASVLGLSGVATHRLVTPVAKLETKDPPPDNDDRAVAFR